MRMLKAGVAIGIALLGFAATAPSAHAQANGAIAYTNVLDMGTATERRAVFKYPGNTQLTHPGGELGKDSDSAPAWSPDGKSLAFIRLARKADQTTEYMILVAKADGTATRVVGRTRYDDGTPTVLANKTPRSLSWSPDGHSLAVGSACGGVGGYCALSLWVDAPSHSSFGNLNGLKTTSAGLDWSTDGILHQCGSYDGGLPPNLNRLFCVYKDAGDPDFPTTIDRDAGTEPDPTGVLGGSPRWMHDPRGNKVLFDYHALFPTHGIHAIEPADRDEDPPDFLGTEFESLTEYESAACTTRSGTRLERRYSYSAPSASPDGKYILVKRSQNVPVVSSDGGVCTFRQDGTGIYVLRKGGIVQNVVALGDGVAEPAWQPSPANLTVVIDDGYDDDHDGYKDELRGLEVELFTLDTIEPVGITPTNPTGGEYQFEAVPSGDYRVQVRLTDDDGGSFEIRDQADPDGAVSADFKVHVASDATHIERHFSFTSSQADFLASSVDGVGHGDRLDEMAAIYWQLRRFVDWVKAEVTTNTGGMVTFYAYATTDPNGDPLPANWAGYFADSKVVLLGADKSDHSNRDERWGAATGHTEWHEYTHHLDATNRGLSSFACSGEDNHEGYVNASSCDSLLEGIASWLAAMYTTDPDYAGNNFDLHTKAWDLRLAGAEGFTRVILSAEEFAVSALLWDLVDATTDFEDALTAHPFGAHLAVRYADTISLPVDSVWSALGGGSPVGNVHELQLKLHAQAAYALTVDLDGDGVKDVNVFDPLFLMHGFFPIDPDQVVTANHKTYHYSISRARDAGLAANADVGQSGHYAFDVEGFQGPTYIPRGDLPESKSANLGLEVRDASGTPLGGADVEITLQYPGLEQVVKRRLEQGDGSLAHLELPLYFSYLPDDGQLPPCDPTTDLHVTATVTARLNGYPSTNTPSFDNCEYALAILASTGEVALAYTLEFPEDSTAPTTTAQTYGAGQVDDTNATESWTIELLCRDPEIGGFASGCRDSEYTLDGGPVTGYVEPFTITEAGSHVIEFRSSDAAANQESFRSVSLTIGAPPPTINGFTPSSGPVGMLVTVNGADFTGATAVTFSGADASFSVGSSTSLTATVPSGASTGPITVTGPGGTATSSTDFVVIPPPAITAFSPEFGQVSSLVTITGSGFPGATRVTFNGVPAGFTVNSPTQVTASVPFGTSTGPIAITTPGGTASSATNFVVTTGPAPIITSFSPMSGAIGASITIKGDALSGASTVTFNGVNAGFRYKGSSIVATVPVGATTGPIRVTTPGGFATGTSSFAVTPPPAISSVSPASGPKGSTVTVTGSNLTGATSVKFGGSSAAFTVVSSTAISATVPKSAKSGPIAVTTPGGTATSSTSFAVTP